MKEFPEDEVMCEQYVERKATGRSEQSVSLAALYLNRPSTEHGRIRMLSNSDCGKVAQSNLNNLAGCTSRL